MQPGQAIFLGAGNMHAYLGGTGVEIMAASDDVLAAGSRRSTSTPTRSYRVLDDLAASSIRWCTPVQDTPTAASRYPCPSTTSASPATTSMAPRAGRPRTVPNWCCARTATAGDLTRGTCAVAVDGERVELTGSATVFRVGGR